MKIHIDFITNSSCADFIIAKHYLSQEQIDQIHDHINVANSWEIQRGPPEEVHTDGWRIKEDHKDIAGDTMMDNFDMMWFLLEIGVDEDYVTMNGCYGN